MEKKSFTESDRREVYSQAFNVELYGYGDVNWIHHWALFARNNDDICRSYFFKKNRKWKEFISLGRKYVPQYIMPQNAYEIEGLAVEEPEKPSFDNNDESNWPEEVRKKLDEELAKKFEEQ